MYTAGSGCNVRAQVSKVTNPSPGDLSKLGSCRRIARHILEKGKADTLFHLSAGGLTLKGTGMQRCQG